MSGIGLPVRYRFQVENGTTGTLNVTVNVNRTKYSSSGALVYETTGAFTQAANSTSLAAGGFLNGTTFSNSTDLFLGGDGSFEATSTDWGGNTVTCYFQPEGSTGMPDDGTGHPVETLSSTQNGSVTLHETFEF